MDESGLLEASGWMAKFIQALSLMKFLRIRIMEIKIKNTETGVIYSNDMSKDNPHLIISIDFCTSFTEVRVQTKNKRNGWRSLSVSETLILPPLGTNSNPLYMIATADGTKGEWVTE